MRSGADGEDGDVRKEEKDAMTEATLAMPLSEKKGELIAPLWHTALLVGLFIALGGAGLLFQNSQGTNLPAQHPNVVPLYVSLIVGEWALVYFVWRGVKRSGTRLSVLIGGRWNSLRAVATDIALGLVLGVAWIGVEKAWDGWLGSGAAKSVGGLLPQGPVEIGLWIAVSLSAGFCEELVFRGYLQRQLRSITHSTVLAVLLQAVVFSAGHAYQGSNAVERIAAYALALGALTSWRRSIRASVVSHAWSDIFSGVLSRMI